MPVASLLLASLPEHYNAVLASASATGLLLVYQILNVSKYRKIAGVAYPFLYATPEEVAADKSGKKNQFNCAQRAHQNTLENYTLTLFSLLYAGLEFPRAAAAFGAMWVAGRVLYTIGYTSGNPKRRNIGGMGSLAMMALLGMNLYTSVQLFI